MRPLRHSAVLLALLAFLVLLVLVALRLCRAALPTQQWHTVQSRRGKGCQISPAEKPFRTHHVLSVVLSTCYHPVPPVVLCALNTDSCPSMSQQYRNKNNTLLGLLLPPSPPESSAQPLHLFTASFGSATTANAIESASPSHGMGHGWENSSQSTSKTCKKREAC